MLSTVTAVSVSHDSATALMDSLSSRSLFQPSVTTESVVVSDFSESPSTLRGPVTNWGDIVGGIVGGVLAVLLLLGIASFILLRGRRQRGSKDGFAREPNNRYVAHAADFKVEEGPNYHSSSREEATIQSPANAYNSAAPATAQGKGDRQAANNARRIICSNCADRVSQCDLGLRIGLQDL
jgi:hypothetical protein